MKIQFGFSSRLLQRKNVLFALFFVFVFCFGVNVSGALALDSLAPAPTFDTVTPVKVNDINSPSLLDTAGTAAKAALNSLLPGGAATRKAASALGGAAASGVGGILSDGLMWLAQGVLTLEAALANAAAILFVWILNPDSFSLLMNNEAIYAIWKIVRDTFNMIFILVLLFSAFATIYQIDKYKYNKILWMVVIMALLVNFSWPISRVIVDFFNTMMYFFVNGIFHQTPDSMAAGLLGGTDMKAIFLPAGSEGKWGPLLLAIVVMFIFMMTLLTLSLMMLIRMIALPILVMFSPVGFAGMAAPLTQGYAKKWWDNLFKYASYGPIAVFMVLVSLDVLRAMQVAGNDNKIKEAMLPIANQMSTANAEINSDVLASLAFFAIPIVLFWMAITLAEKSSSELSSGVTKIGMNAGRWARRKTWGGTKGIAKGFGGGIGRITGATGLALGAQQAWKNRQGLGGSKAKADQEASTDKWARRFAGGADGAQNAKDEAASKRVAAAQDRLKRLGNVTTAAAMLKDSKDVDERKAAALYLAEKDAFTSAEQFNDALKTTGKDFASAKAVMDKAPKELLTNATQFAQSLEMLGANGHKKLVNDLVAKGEKSGLGKDKDGYNAIRSALALRDATTGEKVMENGKEKIDENLEKAYHKRLVAEGQAHIRVNSIVDANNGNHAEAYKKVFDDMETIDVVKQDKDMLQEHHFVSYLQDRTTKSASYKKSLLMNAGNRGNKDVLETWENYGIKQDANTNNGSSNASGSSQSAPPEEKKANERKFKGTSGSSSRSGNRRF